MITIKHAGLVCAKEENADRFYRELLGLIKQEPKILPPNLSKQIFGVDAELTMINYVKGALHFEIFIHDGKPPLSGTIPHICLEVANRKKFLDQCAALGLSIVQIPKDPKPIVFIRDFDQNLFEIK